jgi:diaminohydroxyphosphoribosylaminopyrimidine deaminase/5-amino-6-(5-phosphoribosylamino)uracil reductase
MAARPAGPEGVLTKRSDARFMAEALALARRGTGLTSPNPIVGAVVVRGGRIVGRGYHRKFGGPHAEVLALREAGDLAKGATLFVTLEPCCHYGKTPPCTDAILKAGIRRVVAATRDPNPAVSGKGLAILAGAGIRVDAGPLATEARQVNEKFFKLMETGAPFVLMKAAMTLDGKIASGRASREVISGKEALDYVHRLRFEYDAVLVGVGTVLADDPLLTVRRTRPKKRIHRIVLDSRLRTPAGAKLLRTASQDPVVFLTTERAARARGRAFERRGAAVIPCGGDRVDLRRGLFLLGGMGLAGVLIEGGAGVFTTALAERLVDKVTLVISPVLLGGGGSVPILGTLGFRTVKEAVGLERLSVEALGVDFVVTGYPIYRNQRGRKPRGK